MTKSNKLIAIVAIALVGVFAVSFLTITTSTNTAYAAMPSNGYSYDSHEDIYIDYSGQGTNIVRNVAKADSQASKSDAQIAIYKGQYQAKALDWWWLHSYSAWSPSYKNLASKNDPYTYRGEEVTEYDVQKGTEYLYQRYETRDVYDTKYHTTYQGNKWYNCWIVLFTEKWDGYEGQRANYKVIKRWTTQEKRGTTQVLVQDSTWRTSAPFSWAWENKWSAYSSRTSYRYRSRTVKWNSNSNVGYEQVPLYYSLYEKNGSPIQLGTVWEYDGSLSNTSEGFDLIRFTLNSAGIEALAESSMKTLIDEGYTSTLERILTGVVDVALLKANPYVGAAAIYLSYTYNYLDEAARKMGNDAIHSIQDMINFARKENVSIVIEMFNRRVMVDDHIEYLKLLKTNSTNKSYTSMLYQRNDATMGEFFKKPAYGRIEYLSGVESVIECLTDYCTYARLRNV